MPTHCCVPECTQRGSKRVSDLVISKVSFHKFPTDKKLQKAWLKNIRRDVGKHFNLHSTTKVCSLHFTEKDYWPNMANGQKHLKNDAVPTVFKWNIDKEVKERRTLNTYSFVLEANHLENPVSGDNELPLELRNESGYQRKVHYLDTNPVASEDAVRSRNDEFIQQIKLLEERIATLTQTVIERDREISMFKQRGEKLSEEVKNLTQTIATKNEEIGGLQKQIFSLKGTLLRLKFCKTPTKI